MGVVKWCRWMLEDVGVVEVEVSVDDVMGDGACELVLEVCEVVVVEDLSLVVV